MALTLAVHSEDSDELPEISFDLPRISIGRADSCDLRLPDLSISQRHASIRQRGRDYIILDEGSTNGTFVGPVRLAPQAPRVLQSGDQIRVGRIWLKVRIDAVAPTPNPQLATKDLALRIVAQQLKEQGQFAAPELTVEAGDNKGTTLKLDKLDHRYVLGRSIGADLIITDTNASRRHLEVWRRGAQVYVRDLESKNGSALDGEFMYPDKDVVWQTGTHLRVGTTRVVLSDRTGEALTELSTGADARLSEEEQSKLAAAAPSRASSSPEPTVSLPADTTAPALAAQARKTSRSAKAATANGRLNSADLSVAILALVVMLASLLGLLWMLSGK